jgi:hypothetical protein
MSWNYRLVKHDLPNQDGNIYIHEVYYNERDGSVSGITQVPETMCANITDSDWYPLGMQERVVQKGGAAIMKWELKNYKEDIKRNPEIINYSDHVPKRITNPHMDTLDNALNYAREVLFGIYQHDNKEEVVWLNVTDIKDISWRFHEEIFSMSATPRDELHPDIDFELGTYEGRKGVLRIKAKFSYLLGE